jgi:hypothetical protein
MAASWSRCATPAAILLPFPKAVHDLPEWQAAMEALIPVAERGCPTMFARIGIVRAMNSGRVPPDARSRRKKPRAYRVVR